MWVKEVIIDGFKSYAVRTAVTGWDPSFNAITGLNGSGKSNILDSICFVLGISNLSQVRVNNLAELVYKQGQARVNKATVTVVFDNSDPKMSPVGYEGVSELTISRQIVIEGRNKYMINGATAQLGRVQNLFHSVQLNVNNPHFLIMQGRITKVCNMKPAEILALIEEAAGTRMYETKKKAAQKTIAKKQAKVLEITKILTEEITPQLDKLRKERTQFVQWSANSTEIERLGRFVLAWQLWSALQTISESSSVIKAEEDAQEKLGEELKEIKGQLNENASEAKKINSEKEAEAKKNSKNEDEVQARSKVLTQCTSSWTNKKDTLSGDMKQHAALMMQLKDNTKAIDAKVKEIAAVVKKDEKDNAKYAELAERVESLQGSMLGFNVHSGDDKKAEMGNLESQLIGSQKLLTEIDSLLKQLNARIKSLTSQRTEKAKAQKSTETEYAKLSKELDAKQRELKSIDAKLNKSNFDSKLKSETESKLKSAEGSVASLREQLMDLRSRTANCDLHYSNPRPNFDRSKHVFGSVGRLTTVNRPETAIALEVAAGAKLIQTVVDTKMTAKELLVKGKLQRSTTFIPLDSIAPRVISEATEQKAKKLVGKDNVHTALSLVSYDPKYKLAMEHAFGNTFICADAKSAEAVAFNKDIRTKCVTLDGDTYDPSGTVRGGSRRPGSSMLALLTQLKESETKLAEAEKSLAQLQKKLADLIKAEADFSELSSTRDLLMAEVAQHTTKLGASSHARIESEVKALSAAIDSASAEHEKATADQKATTEKCAELERSIQDFERERANKIKSVEKELAKCKEQLAASSKDAKKRAETLRGLKLESAQLNEDADALNKQIASSQANLDKLTIEVKELEDVVSAKREWFDEAKNKFDAERQKIVDADKSLAKLAKERKKMSQSLTDKELEAKKLGHKIQRLLSDQKEAKERIRSMSDRHEWLNAEKHLFGKAGSDYDFGRDGGKAEAANERLKKLKADQESLSKKINKKVMGMFEKAEQEYTDLMKKRAIIDRDKQKIEQVIIELDRKKNEALVTTHQKVTKDFGSIFGALLPGTTAKLEAVKGSSDEKGQEVLDGLEMRVAFGNVWKDSLSELSGGQRSLLALSLILALLLFKPAPMYILDEIDAALDLSHTQNIGQMLKTHFPQSQFIVVSLKEGMFNNANVIFRTKFVDGVSTVTRTALTQNKSKRK